MSNNIEKSRELRQWTKLITEGLLSAFMVDLYLSEGKHVKNLYNKAVNVYDSFREKKEVKVYNSKQEERAKAEREGYKILHYSQVKWNEVGNRFSLLKRTFDNEGYYYASFNDGKYYIIVG